MISRPSKVRGLVVLAALALTAAIAAAPSAAKPPELANHPLLQRIDAQNWVDQGELTWDDYTDVLTG